MRRKGVGDFAGNYFVVMHGAFIHDSRRRSRAVVAAMLSLLLVRAAHGACR